MNNIMPARRKARAERLAEPRDVRIGKIKIGQLVHKCKGCGKSHPAMIEACPDCGQGNWTATFPQKVNHFRFDDDGAGHKLFGRSPITIPFTFKRPPVECVMVRYECYQGGKLFCSNCLAASESTGKFTDLHKAYRMGREIECNPETCPYSIGGNVTQHDGTSRFISAPQCGEKVTLRGWIPDIPGFDVYEFKSGSIETINNFQDAVQTLTGIINSVGAYIPLKLELKLKKSHGTYPDGNGQFIRCEYYAAYIHFPFSVPALQDAASRRELKAVDIAYVLPAQIFARQLPGAHEGNYDELVDSHAKALPEPEPTLSEKIADVPKWDPPKPQATESASAEKIARIEWIRDEINAGRSDGDKQALSRSMRATFKLKLNARKQIDYTLVDNPTADGIIKWLTQIYDQKLQNESKDGTML